MFCSLAKIFLTRLLLALLLVASMAVPAAPADLPEPSADFYVSDFSRILSDKTTNYIVSINKELRARTGAQVVVATINNLGGNRLESYATALFRSWGIGDREKNNGVLFLIAKNDRKVRIEVGYGLEGAINDAKAGRILDTYVIPYLKKNQWDAGVLNGFNAIVGEVGKEYPSNISFKTPKAPPKPGVIEGLLTAAILLVPPAYMLFSSRRKTKQRNNSKSGHSGKRSIASTGNDTASGRTCGVRHSGDGSSGGGGASRNF